MGISHPVIPAAPKNPQRHEISQEHFAAAMEIVSDAMFALDDTGRIITVFPSAVRLLGFEPEQLLHREIADVILAPPVFQEHRDLITSARLLANSEGQPKSIHRQFVRGNAKVLHGELTIFPVSAATPPFQICKIRDLTECPNHDGRFVLAVEAAPYPMAVADADGRIVLANRKIEQLFGYDRNELLGQTVEIFLPKSHHVQHIQQRTEYAQKPELRELGAGRDLYGLRKDGRIIPVEIGLSPLQEDGELLVLAAVVDISYRKKLEHDLLERANQLAERNAELARRNAELDEFSYVASHDLQEPLRKMASFGKLLPLDLNGDLTPKAAQDLSFIVDAALRMQRLIQDLLALSRAGRAAMKSIPVSLDQCVATAMEQLSATLEERGATIEHDPLPTVIGDPTLLTQVFQNLIGNAVKFTPPDRAPQVRITSKLTEVPNTWRIGVRDNGIGIKPEYLDRIFTPFKRLHSRTEYPGNGIGLAICRRAIERHGGSFQVESTPGEGSHFMFTLQATQEAPQWTDEKADQP